MMSSYLPICVGMRAHDDRLQHAELADAVHELREVVGVEVRARLRGVRHDVVGIEAARGARREPSRSPRRRACSTAAIAVAGSSRRGRRRRRGGCASDVVAGRDECADAPAETGSLGAISWCPSGSLRRAGRSPPRPRGRTSEPVDCVVVADHGLAVARRLGDADRARDDRVEHLRRGSGRAPPPRPAARGSCARRTS